MSTALMIFVWAVAFFFVVGLALYIRDVVADKRQEQKRRKWIRNWKMPENLNRITGLSIGSAYDWPQAITIQTDGETLRTFYMLDMRKDSEFVPYVGQTVTIWYKEADPHKNEHAQLWWADYGPDLPDPDEAVKAAEDIFRQ